MGKWRQVKRLREVVAGIKDTADSKEDIHHLTTKHISFLSLLGIAGKGLNSAFIYS